MQVWYEKKERNVDGVFEKRKREFVVCLAELMSC